MSIIERIQWFGGSSFAIQGPPLIYVNPWRVTRKPFHADAILISHSRAAHFSHGDIDKLRGPDTMVIGNEQTVAEIDGCVVLRPWQSLTLGAASIKAIPAHSPDERLAEEGLGFMISVNYYDIYYAGETGPLLEMERIQPDVAILPFGEPFGRDETLEIIRLLEPRWVIPCNIAANGAGRLQVDEITRELGDKTRVVFLPQST